MGLRSAPRTAASQRPSQTQLNLVSVRTLPLQATSLAIVLIPLSHEQASAGTSVGSTHQRTVDAERQLAVGAGSYLYSLNANEDMRKTTQILPHTLLNTI